MQQSLQLSKEDKMRFMRALYSIFFRDNKINAIEQSVLYLLNQCFGVSTSDYQHYVHVKVEGIAKEINAIQDVRVRVYFMRIIHDVYNEEIMEFFRGPTTDHAKKFRIMYSFLQDSIDLKEV